MKNKTYDILKELALVWLPAIAVCYTALANIWNWPYAGEVSASIMAIDTLLGAILHISSNKYNEEDNEPK